LLFNLPFVVGQDLQNNAAYFCSKTCRLIFRGVAPWHCAKGPAPPKRPRAMAGDRRNGRWIDDQSKQFSSPIRDELLSQLELNLKIKILGGSS